MQEHPPQDSGGYWRSLKKKKDSKGFTLVELIVVIVILAILAAILIPGLLKWIDQAKNKKYELEAREIAMAAEAALTQMYGQGAGALDLVEKDGHYLLKAGGSTDLMKYSPFSGELGKFTDATAKEIRIYGNSDVGAPGKWGGSASGFEIIFTPSGETEPITASLLPGTDRWVINKSSDGSGEDPEENPNEDPNVLTAQKITEAAKAAYRKCEEQGEEVIHYCDGGIYVGGYGYPISNNLFKEEIEKLLPEDVDRLNNIGIKGETWPGTEDDYMRPWDGSVSVVLLYYEDSDGVHRGALYSSSTDGWEVIDGTGGLEEFYRQLNTWASEYL